MGSRRRTHEDLNDPPGSSIHGRVQAEDNVVEFGGRREAPAGPASFEELFLDVHDRLYRALYFITGSAADAEELMQDAFLKLWERWDRVDTIDDPVAYLFRVALNGFRMRARRARVATRKILPATNTRDPFDDVHVREDVRRMLRGISPRQRTAIVLTEILGYSSEQAARIMRIQPTTVRVLASQGRAALRDSEGGEDARR
jgi:RNA polymerase sigma-70 factor (ECF subfamily)